MASAFATGFMAGQRGYQQVLDNDRQKVLDERAAKEFARKEQEWSRADKEREAVDAAFSNLNNVQMGLNTDTQKQIQSTYGMTPAQISQAGGIEGLKAKLASYDVPDAHELQNVPDATTTVARPRFDASQVKPTTASALDTERALRQVALAQRDVAGVRTSLGNERKLHGEDETRNFIKTAKQLWDNRNSSPEAMAAWRKQVAPYTSMISQFDGLDFDARVNPKTGAIEVVPYTGGKVQEVSFEAAAPYLLRSFQLSSEFGNPEAALEAIGKMTPDERKRVMEGSTFRLGVASKVGSSINDAEKLSIEREKLGIQRAEAGAKQAYYNRASQSLREFVDPKGNSVLVDVASLPRGKDGTLDLPQGLRPKAARPEVSQSDVVNYAKALVEADTPDPDAPKTKLTLDKALVIARAHLGGEGYKSAADKLVEAYMTNRGKTQPEEKPAPVGVVKPPRQITTIVPPRTAADINPKPRMTDEEIIKLLSGM